MALRLLILLSLSWAAPIPLPAQGADDAPEAGTARDTILRADTAYNERRYGDAVAGYKRFLADFGTATDAASFLPHVRHRLGAALLQEQKFGEAAEEIAAALELEDLRRDQREDLSFWLGVAHLQGGDPEAAGEAIGAFRSGYPQSPRLRDAELLEGAALLASGRKSGAAEVFASIRKIPDHPHRGRAAVLELHCLVEEGRDREALDLLTEEGPSMDKNISQIATFQTLALQLGQKLLDEDKNRDAIRALQNIWPRDRLLSRQQGRLRDVEASLAQLDASPLPDPAARAQLRQVMGEVRKEIANLEKLASFDASVRFRQATAFHRQGRYRECALLLDDMLAQMEPDAMVETASLSALQSWLAIERHDKALETSVVFEKRFPRSKQLPLVLYLRGTAQQRTELFTEAVATFSALREQFPDSEQAPRAFFMQGFTLLLAERNDEAATAFAEFLGKHPEHDLAEPANYWRGSALAFAKKFPEAREVLSSHPEKFPRGSMSTAAAFRRAYCAQAMKDYATAETELREYLEKYPDEAEAHEARLLLGDALLAQAEPDEGKEVYAGVPPDAGRFHEDAQFKLARVLKLEDDHAGLRALMGRYLQAYPRSPRAAEALLFIGQSWRREDRPDQAVAEYWKAIKEFGDDPEADSVEELFLGLQRLRGGDAEKPDHLADLRELRAQAESGGRETLEVRSIWALGQAARKSDPELASALFREAAAKAKPEKTNARILADGAEAQLAAATAGDPEAAGRRAKAAGLYRDLLKWHPRAAQKDQALAALGGMALEDGDRPAALEYYDRLERDTPWSPLMGEVLMARARVESEAGRTEAAADAYTRLLAAENVPGRLKARALLALGELEMARNRPHTAIPYYQRIYVLYGKWRETVAKAYLRSGEAFEQINDLEAARRTYRELSQTEDLASLPEARAARERLEKLPPATPASS